jgi:hypothetical protein
VRYPFAVPSSSLSASGRPRSPHTATPFGARLRAATPYTPPLVCPRWLGAAGADGSYPVCEARSQGKGTRNGSPAGAQRLGGKDCLVYSVGSGDANQFDKAAAIELGCTVRMFDAGPPPSGLPPEIQYTQRTLGHTVSAAAAPLDVLIKDSGDVGRRIRVLKIDCEGCEWRSLEALLKTGGAHALADVDSVIIEVHAKGRADAVLGDGKKPFHTMLATVALLQNEGFVPYWSHFNPWSTGVSGTEDLLAAVRRVWGAEVADTFEARRDTFVALGRTAETYTPEAEHLWKAHVRPGCLMCCWEMALVRPVAGPSAAEAGR